MPIEQKTGQQQGQGGEGNESTGAAAPSMDEIKKLIAEQVSGAFTSFKGGLGKTIEGAVKGHLTSLEERLENLAHREEPPTGQPAGDAAAKAAELVAKKHEKEMLALKGQVEAERKAREDEKSARMRQEERTALSQVLTEAGVAPESLGMALAYLYTETGRVVRDDKGAICFKSAGQYGGEELVPLKDGVAQWIKTEGKHCLATRDVAGAGTSPGRAPGRQPRPQGPLTPREFGEEVGRAMGYTGGKS